MGDEPDRPDAITVNSRHLSRGGVPWLPVMGEYHFSRYPAAEWREELLKMRAGGVGVVAAYVFWNIHEEVRGRCLWSGDRDLRRFVELCSRVGLDVVARIGPWGHGESRYGGFPDWLMAADCEPRTDDPRYLALVRPWFEQIGAQLRGLTRADGGPIVAVQVENELYDRPGHLLTIKRLARECGIDAPLWTATGWGHAQLPPGEVLPVFGGYPEAAWDDAHDGWPAQSRAHYFFGPGRDDDSIGADLRETGAAPGEAADRPVPASGGEEHLTDYPFATCELGGGMYTSYHRRAIVATPDLAALALVKLGSGSSWQGYYLYHGASQKIGELSTLQESHATGYPNDCPVVNYDFQAPLGEYGQFRDSYRHLRLQHLWLACDGAALATMSLVMPDGAPSDPADRASLRWALRSDGESGFLFVNNHQPVETLPAHDDVRFAITIGGRELLIPSRPVPIPSGGYFAWPLNRPLGGTLLRWASAQVVCVLDGPEPVLVLTQTAGLPVELALDAATVASVDGPATAIRLGDDVVVSALVPGLDCLLRVTAPDGTTTRVLVLDEERALSAVRAPVAGQDRLVMCDSPVVPDGDHLIVYGDAPLHVFPPLDVPLGRGRTRPPIPVEATRLAEAGPPRAPVIDEATGRASAPVDADFDDAAVHHLTVPQEAFDGAEELLLRLDWTGDVGRAYVGGRLVADQFWYGPVWEIGLRRFRDEVVRHGLEVRLLPLGPDAPVHLSPEVRRDVGPGGLVELRSATLVPVTRTVLTAARA
ncbi:beta-galactosidase [Streptosporangium sp. NPDC023615]|uniref:beta-galactosidase n=1 Tax=Streptosporangium sp. NPDC023615 TaxID=3154794 RepID=UPI00342F3F29